MRAKWLCISRTLRIINSSQSRLDERLDLLRKIRVELAAIASVQGGYL